MTIHWLCQEQHAVSADPKNEGLEEHSITQERMQEHSWGVKGQESAAGPQEVDERNKLLLAYKQTWLQLYTFIF